MFNKTGKNIPQTEKLSLIKEKEIGRNETVMQEFDFYLFLVRTMAGRQRDWLISHKVFITVPGSVKHKKTSENTFCI